MSTESGAEQPKKDLTSLLELSTQETEAPVPEQSATPVTNSMEDLGPPPLEMAQSIVAQMEQELKQQEGSLLSDVAASQPVSEATEPTATLEVTSSDLPTIEPTGEVVQTFEPMQSLDFPALEPGTGETSHSTTTATVTPDSLLAASDPITPVYAPPAGASHVKPASNSIKEISQVKNFGEQLSIGRPQVEASPAFSLLASNNGAPFSEKAIRTITDALTSDDYGVRLQDIEVQLRSGKFFVPQISEFAAISLAQKIRDVVDDIQIGLANEMFAGKSSSDDLNLPLMHSENYDQRHEQIQELDDAPIDESDLFSTNMAELKDFQVTRILGTVFASATLNSKMDFETVADQITKQLVTKAFKLGAHGVLGINLVQQPIVDGKTYRVIGSGTAVRGRKHS